MHSEQASCDETRYEIGEFQRVIGGPTSRTLSGNSWSVGTPFAEFLNEIYFVVGLREEEVDA